MVRTAESEAATRTNLIYEAVLYVVQILILCKYYFRSSKHCLIDSNAMLTDENIPCWL